MSDVNLARCRVEPGKADRLREWYARLEGRISEVRESLDHEGVLTETAFLRTDSEGTYLYVYMEADDLGAADAAGNEEAFDIDEQHHEVLADCLRGEWEELETLGHFTNPTLR